MTKPELKTFYMGRIECQVSCVDKFGTEPHYGFTWRDDDGGFHSGWMPVSFVENFTGHEATMNFGVLLT